MLPNNTRIVCADGFSMSVQANAAVYCSPRVNNALAYEEVEIGYPTEKEDLLMDFCEEPERPTETVYAWVPSSVVVLVIAKHGGVVEGTLPAGIPLLKAPA